ncbi:MAG: glucose dehydrogenase [Kofleriaceae bacterium]|nr:glucose dehydrogenase [Kofleriaceae bacterium]
MRRTALLLALLGGCGSEDKSVPLPKACETPITGTNITFRLVAETPSAALLVTSPPNDVRRFVVEQNGRILVLEDTGLSSTPFLDISSDSQFAAGGEQGLLGLAFHPQFATNRTFFIFYTTGDANVVARYQVSATDPAKADPATKTVLITIPDFATNHNGGMMEFGADGYLYIGTGDGGGGGDPMKTAQDPNALLGKMLRIDVDKQENGKEYGIPSGNPFASGGGAPEVWALGLRNPWRWSFDRTTGDMWIADVGQGEIEELTMIPAGTSGTLDFGWSKYEGTSCFDPPCDAAGKTMPQYEATHADGWCSVIGGQVYRGSCYPDMVGTYYFTDYCRAQLMTAKRNGDKLDVAQLTTHYLDSTGTHDGPPGGPSSLHADSRGELFLTTTTTPGSNRGGVWHVEAGP